MEFIGYFMLEDWEKNPALNKQENIHIVPGRAEPNPNDKSGRYQLVSITFETLGWSRASPSVSESRAIEPEDYDWNLVKPQYTPGDNLLGRLKKRQELWIASGICPNPGMYEVSGSDWLLSTKRAFERGYKHYIFLGEDLCVEVLGRGWHWESKGKINW